jgi:hypothetical protein
MRSIKSKQSYDIDRGKVFIVKYFKDYKDSIGKQMTINNKEHTVIEADINQQNGLGTYNIQSNDCDVYLLVRN